MKTVLMRNGLSLLFLDVLPDPKDLWKCPTSLLMAAGSSGRLLLMTVECQFKNMKLKSSVQELKDGLR